MRVLATFSGRTGDILWSLPTVKLFSIYFGQPIDMAVMPAYHALVPLLEKQSYIEKAFPVKEWECTGSPFGDQPWRAPDIEGYDRVYHLTYRFTPTAPLCQFIAEQQGFALVESLFPVLEVPPAKEKLPFVAVGFGNSLPQEKAKFVDRFAVWLLENHNMELIYTQALSWIQAVRAIADATFFLGCRSALAVAAALLNQRSLIFEPEPWRRAEIFRDPFGRQVMPEPQDFASFVRTAEEWLLPGKA